MEPLLRAGLTNAVTATLMAIVVIGLSRPLSRRPAVLHGLWLLVLIKLITPPFYEVPMPWPFATTAPVQSGPDLASLVDVAVTVVSEDDVGPSPARTMVPGEGACQGPPGSPDVPAFDASRWVVAAWLAGSSAVLALSIRRIRRFQRILKEARCGSWLEQDWVDEWAGRLGLRRAPDLWWVPGPISPLIWFVGALPRLILPEELWKRLDARQRSTLLAHELAHLRRGDHFVRILELLVTALFWWHPLVWWMRGPLREVEEQCCDAWVVWALPDAARAYAETLLDTLEFLQEPGRPVPLLASTLGKAPHLRRRLTMIMTGSSRRSPGLPGRLGLLFAAAALLPIGASWAQKPDKTEVRELVIQSDDKDDLLGQTVKDAQVDLNLEVSDLVGKTSADSAAVVVRVEGRDQPATKVELSGSLADVIKKLKAQIDEVYAKGEPLTDADKKRARALAQALEAVAKVHDVAPKAGHETGRGTANRSVRVRLREVESEKELSPEKRAEIIKLHKAEFDLRTNMEAMLKKLQATQARIRELGGDPGDSPTLTWRRSHPATQRERAYTIMRPMDPKTARYTVVRPLKPTPSPSNEQRLEQLEKKLKDFQSELDRLKKSAGEPGPKK